MTGFAPEPGQLAAEAVRRGVAAAVDRSLVRAMVVATANLTDEQRADLRDRAEREQRRRQLAESNRIADAHDRHRSALDRAPHPIVRAVLEQHAPNDDVVDECAGCPQPGSDWDPGADWPCDTFLLVESSLP